MRPRNEISGLELAFLSLLAIGVFLPVGAFVWAQFWEPPRELLGSVPLLLVPLFSMLGGSIALTAALIVGIFAPDNACMISRLKGPTTILLVIEVLLLVSSREWL
jgi:hypothetical protein